MPRYVLRAVVGLGNPGAGYARSRHNAGFWLVDRLATAAGATFRAESKFRGQIAHCNVAGRELLLLKPSTYMNLSGEAVRALATYYKIPATQILIAHDDLDLPPGIVRLKRGGNSRHNGLRSVQQHLGDGYLRLRLGIGHPGDRSGVLSHVLGHPPAAERDAINQGVDDALGALQTLLTDGLDKAVQKLHTDHLGSHNSCG